jgi:hypothetical protein
MEQGHDACRTQIRTHMVASLFRVVCCGSVTELTQGEIYSGFSTAKHVMRWAFPLIVGCESSMASTVFESNGGTRRVNAPGNEFEWSGVTAVLWRVVAVVENCGSDSKELCWRSVHVFRHSMNRNVLEGGVDQRWIALLVRTLD